MKTSHNGSGQDLVGILLAAGQGPRYVDQHLLRPLVDGTPQAVATARNLRRVCPRSIAVLHPSQSRLGQLLLANGLRVLYNEEVAAGSGNSLAAAARATASAPGWLVTFADLPFVATSTMAAIAGAIQRGASLAAPYVNGKRGHPIAFDRHWGTALTRLYGEQCGQELLNGHETETASIISDDAGCLGSPG